MISQYYCKQKGDPTKVRKIRIRKKIVLYEQIYRYLNTLKDWKGTEKIMFFTKLFLRRVDFVPSVSNCFFV